MLVVRLPDFSCYEETFAVFQPFCYTVLHLNSAMGPTKS